VQKSFAIKIPNATFHRSSDKRSLHDTLECLYQQYQTAYLYLDPLELVRQYKDNRDQEVAAFVAAALAVGQYDLIRTAVQTVLNCMKPSPFQFIYYYNPEKDGSVFNQFVYRFYRGRDIGLLASWMARMVRASGSIKAFFLRGYLKSDSDIGPGLSKFVQSVLSFSTKPFYHEVPIKGSGIRHFLADPRDGSACKRLNLFLRWMVRKDIMDLGLWPEISKKQLIIPLDTQLCRFGQYLGLTQRTAPGWKMALDITAALRQLDPEDPVRYDFALCTLGKLNNCMGHPNEKNCRTCEISRFCRQRKRLE
jgi:uncharacterized protein (TIGR02757 family)